MVNNDALVIKIFLNLLESPDFFKNNQIHSGHAVQANLVSLQNKFTKSFFIVVNNKTNFEEDFLKAMLLIKMKYIAMLLLNPFVNERNENKWNYSK